MKPTYTLAIVALACSSALPISATAADTEALCDFGRGFDVRAVGTQDARVAVVKGEVGPVLRVETGHEARWPGATLKAPKGRWDLSRRGWLSVALRNAGEKPVHLFCRVDNPGANGRENCVTESVKLAPGSRGQITFPLKRSLFGEGAIEFIGMRGDPPVSTRLDSANVTQILVFLTQPKVDHAFEIESVEVGGQSDVPTTNLTKDTFFPMIDEFGQYDHADWPGKTHSLEELRAAGVAEEKDLAAHAGPKDRNRYGGWTAGPQLEATGLFRVEKRGGKWWLVDPEGRLFWSHGVDCVHSRAATPISDREHYYRFLPERGSPFAQFYARGNWGPHGYYKGRSYRSYDFYSANLLRKHGEDWRAKFASITHRRLRSWGLNTIANWSDRSIYQMRKTPYVATLGTGGRRIEGSEGYWRKFPDVFDPSFRDSIVRRAAGEKGHSIGDPWCVGYFVDNELGWGDEVSLAVGALESPADQPAKLAFLKDLKAKYGDIAKLNAQWRTEHTSWDALAERREAPDGKRAGDDLKAFYTRVAEAYFRIIRDVLREHAPNQLYMGCRFAWVNERAARAAAKYCDIVSYNRYAYSVADHRLPEGIDLPTIIGEFHFGALDRGMFHTGLRKARDQEHRAQLYHEYVLGAIRNPQIVGTHWFQYKDQATTGRGDGENYQIGFLNAGDRPYPEMRRVLRDIGARMYTERSH